MTKKLKKNCYTKTRAKTKKFHKSILFVLQYLYLLKRDKRLFKHLKKRYFLEFPFHKHESKDFFYLLIFLVSI